MAIKFLDAKPETAKPQGGIRFLDEGIKQSSGVNFPTYTKDVNLPEKKFYVSSPEKRSEWAKQGKVGWWEFAKETKGKDLYYGDISDTAGLVFLTGRLKKNEYSDVASRKADEQKLTDWMTRQEELETRGLNWDANIYRIVAQIPTFAAEMFVTGGLASATRKAATTAGIKAAGVVAKKIAKKGVAKLAKKGAAVLAREAAVGVARTTVMPHRYISRYAERRLNDSISITDKGISIIEESKESPTKAFIKAYSDVFVEYYTETLGGTLLKPAGKVVGKGVLKRMPKAAAKSFEKLAKAIQRITPKGKATELFTKGGFNGLLEEYGEERLGGIFRTVLGLDERDIPTLDKLQEAVFPKWEQALTELGAFSIWGGASIASQRVFDFHKATGKTNGESQKIVDNMTQTEKEAFVDTIEDKQIKVDELTPEQAATIEQGIAEEAAVAKEEAKAEPEVAKEVKAPKKAVEPSKKVVIDSIKDVQVKGRLEKLDDEIKDVRGQIDSLGAERKGLIKEELSTEAIDKRIDKLQKREDIIDSELGEILTTAKENIALEKEKITLKAEEVKKIATKERIKGIQSGLREGRIKTQEGIKSAQTEIIKTLNESGLEAKDKAKFIATIKNVQTVRQLNTALKVTKQRISALEEAAGVRSLDKQIKKELKTTKPVKKGQKRVGKFDPESNKLFDELRGLNLLTKENAQAELEIYPETANSGLDLVKKRFLSLKANGKNASAELHRKVLEDIKNIKEIGAAVKSDAEMIEKINRQDLVDGLISAVDKSKAKKETVKTKIGNAYREGFTNIYSMLNSIAGKDMAEKYDPEISENKRDTKIYFKTKKMADVTAKIYNEKNVTKIFENMAKAEYEITDNDGLTTEISKLEVIDIYNSIKNEKTKENYHNAYGENKIEELMGELTPTDIQFADYIQEEVQGYREILNQRNIEMIGRDLGFVENYWPATSEYKENVFDDVRIQGETPSALKERAKGLVIPVPINAWSKAQKHISQAEHVANLSREHETLKRLFTDRKVKHGLKQKFGDGVYNTLMDQIDGISLNAHTNKIDAVTKVFGIAVNNWVTAKIALNPSTFVRQLISTGNYIEKMNAAEWVKGFSKGIASPKETFNFMWTNAPFLEARFNRGYSEAIKDAISGAEKLNSKWGSWTKFLSSLTRVGDVTAIIYGGFPLVQSELAKGKSMKQAIETFEKATLKAQQSGLNSSLSQFQNMRNSFARLFLAFKNTANQYSRKMADAVISRQNGDISNEQFAKTMAIYAVIQPVLYVLSGLLVKEGFKALGATIAGREPEEIEADEVFDSVLTQLVVSPVNAIPVFDDIVGYAMRKATGQNTYKVMSTPLLDDLSIGMQKIFKKEVSAEDYLIVASSVLEPTTALPINTFTRYYGYITGKRKGKKKYK